MVCVACLTSVVLGCGGQPHGSGPTERDGVRIASFDFDENRVLAELLAQAIEASGLPVVRLGAVGPREVVAPALEEGLIDLVPEYLGTASNHFGADRPDRAGLARMLRQRGLLAVSPSPAQDVNVLVVTAQTAARDGLVSISDLVPVAGELRIGGPVECPDRPLCLIGLRDVYGLVFERFVPQRSLAVTAEALRRDEIDVGVMFSTAPEVSSDGFVVLTDDRSLQPPENIVPIVRSAAVERWGPGLVDTLNRVCAALTTDALRSLNRVVGEGATVEVAVADWLRTVDLGP